MAVEITTRQGPKQPSANYVLPAAPVVDETHCLSPLIRREELVKRFNGGGEPVDRGVPKVHVRSCQSDKMGLANSSCVVMQHTSHTPATGYRQETLQMRLVRLGSPAVML